MPRETVHVQNTQPDGEPQQWDDVDVAWDKSDAGTVVMVATRGNIRRMVENWVDSPQWKKGYDPDTNDGFGISLDREQLERFIRSLQKAGRDVFGRSAW